MQMQATYALPFHSERVASAADKKRVHGNAPPVDEPSYISTSSSPAQDANREALHYTTPHPPDDDHTRRRSSSFDRDRDAGSYKLAKTGIIMAASTVASLSVPVTTTTFAAAGGGDVLIVVPRRAGAKRVVWFPAAARRGGGRLVAVRSSGPATPPEISDKVSESIKQAEETCADDQKGDAECAAAWDEVEELSATASHARDSLKETNANDPLEKYCKDNPDSEECRIYDN
jgi:hypothetical protein|uniref:CP12 domain-containing protein n=2 Tax=Zea mays TaxID=4577 RepID=A0A804UIK9_MAIZE